MNVENTRDEILAVACGLFAQKGYDAVGVQQIAELSKITKPTLYYYFGSKIGILRALIQEKGALLYECLEAVCVDRHDFFNSVQDIIRAEIDFARREPDFFRLHRALLDAPDAAYTYRQDFTHGDAPPRGGDGAASGGAPCALQLYACGEAGSSRSGGVARQMGTPLRRTFPEGDDGAFRYDVP